MDDFSDLEGMSFDPSRVHPLVRTFYEKTAHYKMTLVPRWHPLIRPAFWVFRRFVAIPIEQFCFPVSPAEAEQGLDSRIDTLDVDIDGKIDVRAWVRTVVATRAVMYVGIYTVYRPQVDSPAYVSVGFPLPDANITATLLPTNKSDGLVLRSHVKHDKVAGDYLCDFGRGEPLRVRRMSFFSEKIHVYVNWGDELITKHDMYLFGGEVHKAYLQLEATALKRVQ